MMRDCLVMPPLPEQVKVKVFSPPVLMVIVSLPLIALEPVQAPEAKHVFESLDAQESSIVLPTSTEKILEEKDKMTFFKGVLPSPPQEVIKAIDRIKINILKKFLYNKNISS